MSNPSGKRKSPCSSDEEAGPAHKKTGKTSAAPIKAKRKRMFLGGVCCECGDDRCYELTKGFRDLGDPRGGHATIPKEPTPAGMLKSKPRSPSARAIKSAKRKLWIVHLQLDPAHFEPTAHLSLIHFHPAAVSHGSWDDKKAFHLPTTILKEVAMAIKAGGFSYTDNDKCPGSSSDYLPVPNYKWENMAIDLAAARLHHNGCTSAADATTDATLAVRQSPSLVAGDRVSPDLKRAKSVVESDPHEAAERIVVLEHSNADLMLQVADLKKRNADQNAVIETCRNTTVGKRLDQYEKFLEGTGLTKVTLLSDSWYASHPKSSHHFWGLGGWHNTVNMCLALFRELEDPAHLTIMDRISKRGLGRFGQCLVAKMRMHGAVPVQMLADMWGVSIASICNYCKEWIPKWGRKGKLLSLLPVSPQHLLDTLPESFVEAGMPKATVQIDGTDMLKDEDRSHSLLTKAGWSNKSGHAAYRGLAWTTPRGLNFEHTPLCLGKVEETALNEWWKPRLSKIPPGHEVLADRGFDTCARHYPNYNFHRCPTRLAGRKQFKEPEVKSDYQICRLRYTCEVVFARVKSEKGLKVVIPQHFFGEVQHFWDWACAGSNLCKPLMPLGK